MSFILAANEAIRTTVELGTSTAMQVYYGMRNRLEPALSTLSARADVDEIFGALALANVSMIHGGYVAGWYDRETRQGLDREISILTELATSGVKSQHLGFVALGAGRIDLVAALSDDPTLARLATGDAKAYAEVVGTFPTPFNSVSWAELGFVARAYAILVEKRGPGGIGAGADWLRKSVKEGPQPVHVVEVPDPIPRIPATWVSFHDVQALWGGRIVDIAADGTVTVIVVEPGASWRMQKGTITEDERGRLMQVLAENDPRRIIIPMRDGLPDEVMLTIEYVADGATTSVWMWGNDRQAAFDIVASAIGAIGHRVTSA